MKSCFDLSGRVAVVIGATSGIGRQIALGLAEHGADVVPAGRRIVEVQKVCRRIEQMGRRATAFTVDVKSRDSIEKLRDSTVEALGRVDILVNAAAFTERKPTLAVNDGNGRHCSIQICRASCALARFSIPRFGQAAGDVLSISLRWGPTLPFMKLPLIVHRRAQCSL